MVAYEIYWRDEIGKDHFIGILPERRKKQERITRESIINWGRKVIDDDTEAKNLFFTQVKINEA